MLVKNLLDSSIGDPDPSGLALRMTIFIMKIIIYTDGGSRGNPGPAALGVVICDQNGQVLKKYGQCLDEATNNEAEYQAVIYALKKVKLLFGKQKAKQTTLEIRGDSELVVQQLNHQYKLKEPHIQQLFIKVWNLMMDYARVEFKHIPREKNKEADQLVNQALDNQDKETTLPGM